MRYVLVAGGSDDRVAVRTVEWSAPARGVPAGWILLAVHGRRWHWSMPLAARGAAPTAPPRVAQAVAVRVLNESGVRVRAWHGAAGAANSQYVAELEEPPEPEIPG